MEAALHKRGLGWVFTVAVLVVVLITGSRLIYLSAQHRAAMARATAASVGAGLVAKIEIRLRQLADRATQAAAGQSASAAESGAVSATEGAAAKQGAASHPLGVVFWMTADDKVRQAPPNAAADSSGLASEWASAESIRPAPPAAVLGPVRLGSEWLLAVRAPLGSHAPRGQGWAVAYADLEELTADTHLARLVDQGYDFELGQVEPRSARSRVFVSSSTDPLADSVSVRIRLPNGYAPAVAGSYLRLAVRPRAGWFPATDLASDIGLLIFLAWLLAFGVHDLSHALQRSRWALATSRRRFHAINRQLSTEMQQ